MVRKFFKLEAETLTTQFCFLLSSVPRRVRWALGSLSRVPSAVEDFSSNCPKHPCSVFASWFALPGPACSQTQEAEHSRLITLKQDVWEVCWLYADPASVSLFKPLEQHVSIKGPLSVLPLLLHPVETAHNLAWWFGRLTRESGYFGLWGTPAEQRNGSHGGAVFCQISWRKQEWQCWTPKRSLTLQDFS